MNRTQPPPAANLVILAGDLLAQAARQLLEQLACGSWETAERLRQSLDTYEHVRIGDEITSARSDDPQRCTVSNWEVAPKTQRSARS